MLALCPGCSGVGGRLCQPAAAVLHPAALRSHTAAFPALTALCALCARCPASVLRLAVLRLACGGSHSACCHFEFPTGRKMRVLKSVIWSGGAMAEGSRVKLCG